MNGLCVKYQNIHNIIIVLKNQEMKKILSEKLLCYLLFQF